MQIGYLVQNIADVMRYLERLLELKRESAVIVLMFLGNVVHS